MKKIVSLAAAALMVSNGTFAGGLLTNTNQNAAFLRQMSQDAIIDITGLYANPAGTAFLPQGWHLSLNVQNAKQSRDITTTFPLFALNANNRNVEHKFEGNAYAPVIPSFQLSYNHGKWSVNANFAIGGGGGKCEFDQGLGSFEALYAGTIYNTLPAAVTQGVRKGVQDKFTAAFTQAGLNAQTAGAMAQSVAASAKLNSQVTGYTMNSYMKGRNYVFGLTLGGTYKFLDNLSGFVGLRFQYASNNYNGYVQDVTASYLCTGNIPANPALGMAAATPVNQSGTQDLSANTLTLNCDQTGFGVAPIIGVNWKANEQWNFAAKYEAPTKMNLKNKTEMNDYAKAQALTNPTLAQFADGAKVREDIPGLLTLGAQYSPIKCVRLMAGFHEYFDKSAKKYGDKQKLISKNTWELTAGAEWDINKWVTVSASWQRTKYGLSDEYMNDLSFNLSNNGLGVGVRVNATEWCHIDLGYMHTFYQDRTVTAEVSKGVTKSDLYHRTNRVWGLGVNFDF